MKEILRKTNWREWYIILKQGILKMSENKIYEGEFKDNCLSGFGKLKSKDKIYIGQIN